MKQNIEQEKSIINETLLNSIPGGIIIVKVVENNIECLYFNEAFAKLSGRTHDELQRYLDSGVNVIDIIYEADRKKFLTSILGKIQSDNEVDIDIIQPREMFSGLIWSLQRLEKRMDVLFFIVYVQSCQMN